jgi:hypothetical protein
VPQRTSGPCGLFSGAKDKLKLSNEVIEKVFTIIAIIGGALFHVLRNPLSVLSDTIAASSSINAVNISSARTGKRFRSR